jgi:hypothetical protein
VKEGGRVFQQRQKWVKSGRPKSGCAGSAFPPKADVGGGAQHVRKVPFPDIVSVVHRRLISGAMLTLSERAKAATEQPTSPALRVLRLEAKGGFNSFP